MFHSLGYKFLGDGGKLGKIASAGVLQLKREATGRAEPPDRGRIEGKNQGFGNFGKFLKGRRNKPWHLLILRFLRVIPVLQRNEHRRLIRPAGAENKVLASQGICRMDCRNRLEITFHPAQNFNRPCQRGTVRQLDDGNEITLIFFRKKLLREWF